MTDSGGQIIDPRRAACLCARSTERCDSTHLAAVTVGPDGAEHLILAERAAIGDEHVRYDPTCSAAAHEQLGPLPLDYVARITASRRVHRCGRRTVSGTPCQTPVHRPGDACGWHRQRSTP
ncbi:hypothetical protein [uncultured Mycobacterium sp.]|uniref:hypothetical protein n=1 Tax=uncultured Mycobacterium sp. TaxID=171292 RepID=UPI0035CBD4DD